MDNVDNACGFFSICYYFIKLHFDGLESGSPLNEGKEAFDYLFLNDVFMMPQN